eukprot:3037819-Prymnesium_polylepis.1
MESTSNAFGLRRPLASSRAADVRDARGRRNEREGSGPGCGALRAGPAGSRARPSKVNEARCA